MNDADRAEYAEFRTRGTRHILVITAEMPGLYEATKLADYVRTLSFKHEMQWIRAMPVSDDNDKGPECTICKGPCKKDHG